MTRDFRFWLIIAGTAALTLIALGNRDLWDPDEPRYAVVAREMVEDGDWLMMHLNGEPYPDKPPLYFWAVGLLSKATGGIDEFTARLPSAVSGIVVVALSMLLAGRMFGRRTGALTGAILASSYIIIGQSRYVHMDMPLAMVMMLMFLVLYRGAFIRKDPRLWLPFFALGAVGILIKGPVGLLVPVFAGFAFLTFLKVVNLPQPGLWAVMLAVNAFLGTLVAGIVGMLICIAPAVVILLATKGLKPIATRWFLIGLVIFVVIVSAWLVPMLIKAETQQPGLAKEILVTQNFGRFGKAFSHEAPFYYYYFTFPMLLIPWIFVLPWACAPIFKKESLSHAERRSRLFLFAWVVGIFVFFSLSSSKRELYVIPALPAVAMLAARYFDRLLAGAKTALTATGGIKAILAVFCGVMATVGLGLLPALYFLGKSKRESVRHAGELAAQHALPLAVACAVLLTVAIIGLVAALKGRWKRCLAATTAGLLLCVCAAEFLIMPSIVNPLKSARTFTAESLGEVGNHELVWYGNVREGVLFYGRRKVREIRNPEELAEFMENGQERFFLTTDHRMEILRKNDLLHGVKVYTRLSRHVGSKNLLLLSNRPLAVTDN